MTKLIWNATGERFFEAGVDRGVLYPKSKAGVVWNGLTAVSEDPSGGIPTPYYFDGIKYLNVASSEEFSGAISAYSAPAEFAECDGTASIANGLFITQQPRKQFQLSYRTMVGNDSLGLHQGYKIHLVYNAIAHPTNRAHNSISNSTEPVNLSWNIECVPPPITGFKPSSHLVLDSRFAYDEHIISVENILYGQDVGSNPRMPTISELITIFNSSLTDTSYGHGSYGHTPYGG